MFKPGQTVILYSVFDVALSSKDGKKGTPEYLRTLDPKHLSFDGEPTVFVVRIASDEEFMEWGEGYSDRKAQLEVYRKLVTQVRCGDIEIDPADIPIGARLQIGQAAYRLHVEPGLDPTSSR